MHAMPDHLLRARGGNNNVVLRLLRRHNYFPTVDALADPAAWTLPGDTKSGVERAYIV